MHTNIPLEGSQKKNRVKIYLINLAENFPSLKKETDIQVQEAQKILKKINPNRPTPRHTIIKMEKAKERIPKVAKRKREGHIQKNPHKAIS